MNLGTIAVNALIEAFSKDGIDRTYGIYAKDKRFYLGNKRIDIKDNDIIINDADESGTNVKFDGTPGLWRLITEKNIPDKTEFTPQELASYFIMMFYTKTIYIGNDPARGKRGGTSEKLKLIKPFVRLIEEEKQEEFKKELSRYYNEEETEGEGLKILPSDPNALIDRFDLLFSSKKAGHTGVRNEIVSILDELKRQGVLKTNEYKKLNSLIKK